MADFLYLDKCCVHSYYQRECPKGERCEFPHRQRSDFDLIGDLGDCVVGRIRQQKVCRYYKRGNCIHQQNCHFRHDNDNSASVVAANNYLNSNNNQSPSTNMPSTSRQSAGKKPATTAQPQQQPLIELMDGQQKKEDSGGGAAPPLSEAASPARKKHGAPSSSSSSSSSWVDAPEFVPRQGSRSYAQAAMPDQRQAAAAGAGAAATTADGRMCPYANKDGLCRNAAACRFVHGEMCDMCERLVLHPHDEEQRKKHRQECIQQHEKNMELSFAVARSKEKTCGICFEVIMEKATGEQRFGILPNCSHCFCLSCIRKWRQARQFENKIIRACPECRTTSDFVCPSMYWVDTKEDKDKLIDDYKKALSKKDCKYFKKGAGKCPFGNKCFYLHALANGTKMDVGPPPRQRRMRGFDNADVEVLQVMLWDFLDEREFPFSFVDDIEDLVSFFTDSDESDWSEFDLFFD